MAWDRSIVTMACAALLCAPVAFAGGEKDKARDEKKCRVSNEDVMASLEQLRALVESQNRQIEAQQAALQEQVRKMQAMEARLASVSASSTPPRAAGSPAQESSVKVLEGQMEAMADSQTQLVARVGQVESNAATAQKSVEGKLRQLGNFAFSGDVRLRYEPFFGGGTPPSPSPAQRNRFRVRARFNANAQFNSEFSGGISLASGEETDPISTNETLTSFFERKNFRLDRAFVKYTPQWAKPLSITGGKFAYTWVHTEMTLDNDLNPEGLSEVLSFNLISPVLRNVTLVAFQLPFNESGGGKDSFMQGAQGQAQWALGSRATLFTSIAFYDWKRADVIRAAQTSNGLSGNTNNNAATATQFASKFGIVDVIGRLDLTTWSTRWPVQFVFNYANNTRACDNLSNISGTPPACDPRDNHAYWAEFQIGQTREQGDLNFGYTFLHIDREAVLGAFNFSDLRASTGVLTHRLNFGYQAYKNVSLNYTGLFGRALTTMGQPAERFLKRMQFDLIYKF